MSRTGRGLRCVLLCLSLLVVGCRDKLQTVKQPVKKQLSPIERYVRQHFDREYTRYDKPAPLLREDGPHYLIVDSLPIKSIQATLYHISSVPSNLECVDCSENYVIRNNISGAFFRFYQEGWAANSTKHEDEVLAINNRMEPINNDLVGLEAFLNERSAPITTEKLMGAVDTIIQRSRFANQRIRNVQQLDSILHYPKAKSVWPLRQALIPRLNQRNVLLYSSGRHPAQVIVCYYELVGTGSFYQINLVHVRFDRSLTDEESDPITAE